MIVGGTGKPRFFTLKPGLEPEPRFWKRLGFTPSLPGNSELKCFEILIEGGAESSPKTSDGKTPLDLASDNHRSHISAILRKTFWEKFKGLKMNQN